MSASRKAPEFHSLFQIREFYGMSVATERRWRTMGCLAGDPFPSTSPPEVLNWYRRHHKKGTPHHLVAAVRAWERNGKA